jgi:hypothetical protein
MPGADEVTDEPELPHVGVADLDVAASATLGVVLLVSQHRLAIDALVALGQSCPKFL